jgi:hypothetical protein
MRQILSTAIVALVVAALTAVSVSALAQSSPATDSTYSPASVSKINADKVDGKHAVGAGATIPQRRGKLVATDKTGFLPRNIVKPLWPLIQHMPAGFADGVDDQGVTGVTVTRLSGSNSLPANSSFGFLSPSCPTGSAVVGGGFLSQAYGVTAAVSAPSGDRWYAAFENHIAAAITVTVYVLCLATDPAVSLTSLGKAVVVKTPKRR